MKFNNIKVVISGDINTGKSSIISRIVNNKFNISEHNPTIGVEYLSLIYKETKINAWDLSGDKNLKPITDKYIDDKDIIILVYSIDDIESLSNMKKIYNSYINNGLIKQHNIIVVCNKLDLVNNNNKKSISEGSDWAKYIKAEFIILSAKNGNNLKALLDMIVVNGKKQDILTQKLELKQKKEEHILKCNYL